MLRLSRLEINSFTFTYIFFARCGPTCLQTLTSPWPISGQNLWENCVFVWQAGTLFAWYCLQFADVCSHRIYLITMWLKTPCNTVLVNCLLTSSSTGCTRFSLQSSPLLESPEPIQWTRNAAFHCSETENWLFDCKTMKNLSMMDFCFSVEGWQHDRMTVLESWGKLTNTGSYQKQFKNTWKSLAGSQNFCVVGGPWLVGLIRLISLALWLCAAICRRNQSSRRQIRRWKNRPPKEAVGVRRAVFCWLGCWVEVTCQSIVNCWKW